MPAKSPSLTSKQKEIQDALHLLQTASLEDWPTPSPEHQRFLDDLKEELRKFQRLEKQCEITSNLIYDRINSHLPDDLQLLLLFYRGLISTRPEIDKRNYTSMLRHNRMAKQLLAKYQEPDQGPGE